MSTNGDHRVLAVLRLLDVLECFEAEQRSLTLQEVADRIGVPRSSTFRLLHTLEARGYLEVYENTGTYWPTSRLYNIGRVAVVENRLRQLALPYMEDLHRRFDEKINLGTLARHRVVYVDTIAPSHYSRLRALIGATCYVHASSLGKAILAFLSDREVDAILAHEGMPRLTRRTLTSPAALKSDLCQVRRRGYAINVGEMEENQHAFSAPIFNQYDVVVGALCVSGTPASIEEKDPDLIAYALLTAGLGVSQRFGYIPRADSHAFYAALSATAHIPE